MGPTNADRGCQLGQWPLDGHDWIDNRYPEQCYWYPARDCPGWAPGDTCNRMDKPIPAEGDNK